MINYQDLTEKVRSDIVLSKAGLYSLSKAVSEVMACTIWKARNEITLLGHIFKEKLSTRNTQLALSGNLCQPVPGHLESAANRLAQVWNLMNLLQRP